MNIWVIILTLVSTFSLLAVIILEGKIRNKDKKITIWGILLIVATLIGGIGNGVVSICNIKESNKKNETDSLSFAYVNKKLKDKAKVDSLEIIELKAKIADLDGKANKNLLASEKIRAEYVNNTLKEFENQRILREKINQNAYLRMRNEIEENLKLILTSYNKSQLLPLSNSSYFEVKRFSYKEMANYMIVSTNKNIVDLIMEANNDIELVNTFANNAAQLEDSIKKQSCIENLIRNIEAMKFDLYYLFSKIYNIDNYNVFEKISFYDILSPKIDYNQLNTELTMDILIKRRMIVLEKNGIKIKKQ